MAFEVSGVQAQEREQYPTRLVKGCDIVPHVHVAHVIQMPWVDDSADGHAASLGIL